MIRVAVTLVLWKVHSGAKLKYQIPRFHTKPKVSKQFEVMRPSENSQFSDRFRGILKSFLNRCGPVSHHFLRLFGVAVVATLFSTSSSIDRSTIFKKEFQIVNIDKIASLGLEHVDAQTLKENGLIRSALKPVKILGNGDLNKNVHVTATVFSKSAKQKIEEAGGTATEL